MKNKLLHVLLCVLMKILLSFSAFGNEVTFEANFIELIDKDRRIIAKKNVKIYTAKGLIINAEEMDYDKDKQIVKAKGNIFIESITDDIELFSDELVYYKNLEELIFSKNVKIKYLDTFLLSNERLNYNIIQEKILSDDLTNITDELGNRIITKKIIFLLKDRLLKTSRTQIFDIQKNEYNFNNVIIDFASDEMIGDDVKINFFKGAFGNQNNDPRLRGNYVYGDKDKTIIKKGVFTTCKKRNNKCPPWQFKASEVMHDKNKKTIYYKSAWLEIYDKPVMYFPRFFHPDPTVKRQSGFLMPTIKNSSTHGSSLSLPYFHVISNNKDLTFTPQIFGQDEGIFQNEYRQENKNSSHISDFSIKTKNGDSKSHFFSNTISNLNLVNFDKAEMEINVETTSNNTYLKSHDIKNEITSNKSLLNSFFSLKASNDDLFLETKLEAFEDLTKENSSDRYQFMLPSFELSKSFNNNLNLNTNGHYKNYNTNVFEKVLSNDLKYSSVPKINSKGLVNKFNLLFKNVTTESDKSSKYENRLRSHNYGSFLYDLSFPMKNGGLNYDNYLTGKAAFMYSPNKNRNNQTLDRKINAQNVFSQNRLGLSDSVEGGQSITLGGEYKITNKANDNILSANLASVFRDKNERSLPNKSTINNKSSDLVGSLLFKPNQNLNIDYNFSLDNDLSSTNYNLIKTDFTVNKFVTTFEYLQEDDEVGNESYFANEMKFSFDNQSSLKYKTRRNRKKDLTEYYNIIYEYKNDCLTAAIQYNKEYYSDKDLKPTEEIFFSISIIPFTQINSPSKNR